MKQLNLIVLTYMVGYKSLKETKIDVSYHIETVPNYFCVDLLGETFDKIIFDRFEVEGLFSLTNEYSVALEHLEGLVREFIRYGDKPPMTGQIVFNLNSAHWTKMSAWFDRLNIRKMEVSK